MSVDPVSKPHQTSTPVYPTYRADRSLEEGRLRDAVMNDPVDLAARRELASLLLEKGSTEQAVVVLADAVRINYRDVATLIAFAHAQRKWGNNAEAEQACLLALEQEPEQPQALAALAHVLIARNQVLDAIPVLERSLRLQPNNIETRRLYGTALQVVGRLDDARRELLQVITSDPSAIKPYVSLSEMVTFTTGHDLLTRMQEVLTTARWADDPRLAPLHYALGKAYDDVRDYDRAFCHFEAGARLQRSLIAYDEEETLAVLDDVMAVFTPALFARRPPIAAASGMTPVFIIGMPRAGSSLLEQILSRHAHVCCLGEATILGETLAMLRRESPELPLFPELMRAVDTEALARVSSAYRAHMHKVGGSARAVVNKFLMNFMFMGAIYMIMPDARFIVAKRNALDTCLSAFASYFEFNIPYSCDLGELGRFYRKYEEVVTHWARVLPQGVMRTVDYQDVVSDIEGETRGMLEFLGLSWDPACLAFDRSDHPVRTASLVQVRRPLYQSSVGRWRRYENHLKPLVDALQVSGS